MSVFHVVCREIKLLGEDKKKEKNSSCYQQVGDFVAQFPSMCPASATTTSLSLLQNRVLTDLP